MLLDVPVGEWGSLWLSTPAHEATLEPALWKSGGTDRVGSRNGSLTLEVNVPGNNGVDEDEDVLVAWMFGSPNVLVARGPC